MDFRIAGTHQRLGESPQPMVVGSGCFPCVAVLYTGIFISSRGKLQKITKLITSKLRSYLFFVSVSFLSPFPQHFGTFSAIYSHCFVILVTNGIAYTVKRTGCSGGNLPPLAVRPLVGCSYSKHPTGPAPRRCWLAMNHRRYIAYTFYVPGVAAATCRHPAVRPLVEHSYS